MGREHAFERPAEKIENEEDQAVRLGPLRFARIRPGRGARLGGPLIRSCPYGHR